MIKAIKTKYKGYNFRSRLEARWAVFFDAMGIKWEYEPEGFDLGKAGWYLPDFRIEFEGRNSWVEVKGGIYREAGGIGECSISQYEGKEKTDEFAYQLRKMGGRMFLLGDIPNPDCNGEIRTSRSMFTTRIDDRGDHSSIQSMWETFAFTIIDHCGDDFSIEPSYIGYNFLESSYILNGQKEDNYWTGKRWRTWWPEAAYTAARSARFEHGETPCP